MKTRPTKTRLLTALLTLCMVLTPTCAFAADTDSAVKGLPSGSGSTGTEVKPTVRNNYTDTRTDKNVDLVSGTATVEDDLSYLNGETLTFANLGDLSLQAVYDETSQRTTFTVDISSIQRQQEEQLYNTDYEKELKNKMTTTYDGSSLSYAGSDVNPETGKTIIYEIRDDYYTRNHVYITFRLIIPAAVSNAITAVSVENVKFDYQPGDAPQAAAQAAAADAGKYAIAYEYWEQMESDGNGYVVPTAYWYSDDAKNNAVSEDERITSFAEGKTYMYSIMLRAMDGHAFAAADAGLTMNLNGEAVNMQNITVGQDGTTLFAVALKTIKPAQASGTSSDYQFIEGANSTWTQNSDGTLTFRANGDYSKFTAVRVDGSTIPADKYTSASGSTIITLNADYLATLSVARHTLTVVYTDGECSTDFEIKAADNTTSGTTTPETTTPETTTPETATPESATTGTATSETATSGSNPGSSNPGGTSSKTEAATSPKTADSSNLVLWISLLFASGGILTGVMVFGNKKKAIE